MITSHKTCSEKLKIQNTSSMLRFQEVNVSMHNIHVRVLQE